MRNKLYYGDNIDVLRRYIRDETVDLCYIDPPFNSKRNYNQIYNNIGKEDRAQTQAFIDTWTWDDQAMRSFAEILDNTNGVFSRQSVELIIGLERVLGKNPLLAYLVSMSLRIAEIHRVLKSTGSFYLHCDPTASHYLKLICDAIFCARGGDYLNEIIWKRTSAHNNPNRFGRNNDIIFFYSKSKDYTFNPIFIEHTSEQVRKLYSKHDKKGTYSSQDLTGAGLTNGDSGKEWHSFNPSKNGRHWAVPQEQVENIIGKEQADRLTIFQKLDLLNENGFIEFTINGTPRFKRYLTEVQGSHAQQLWTDIPPIAAAAKERLGYPTQKPEALLERIIKASSNEGDLVLDAYCGCGTTVAVAQRLNRNWIGIDITYQSVSLILKRLTDTFGESVMDNVELNGVPRDFAAAEALANKQDDRTRKEFEKWAALTFSKNKAIINEKKGGDGGIDAIAFILDLDDKAKTLTERVLISVKSSKTLSPSVIRDLNGAIEREKAVLGYLITLYPMENLVKESKKYDIYTNKLTRQEFPRIEVISIQELLEGKRMNLPSSLDVVKSAKRAEETKEQHALQL